MSDEYIIINISVPNLEVGKSIAQQLLLQKRVACVNIIPHVQSLYWWENKIEEAQEFLLICKTLTSCLNVEFYDCVKEMHPYEVPEIIAYRLLDGYPPYLEWIRSITK